MTKKKTTDLKIQVTQIHSGAGRKPDQIATLKGLGLNKIRKVRVLEDTPSIRGMVDKVKHLVEVKSI